MGNQERLAEKRRVSLLDRVWLWGANICPKHLKPKSEWTGCSFPGLTWECPDCRLKSIQRENRYEDEVRNRRDAKLEVIRAKLAASPEPKE